MLLPDSLVVDTNILFSFFKKGSSRRVLIDALLDAGVTLITPYFAFEELLNNKERIKKFSKISDGEFQFLYNVLYENLSARSRDEYISFVSQATKLTSELKDVSFFALSLSLNNCQIWSDEKSFSKQHTIKISSTKELFDLLK